MSIRILVSLKIQKKIYRYDLTLQRRVTVVVGNSATGKSTLVKALAGALDRNHKTEISVTLNGEEIQYSVGKEPPADPNVPVLMVFDEYDAEKLRELQNRSKYDPYLYDRNIWVLYMSRSAKSIPVICSVPSFVYFYTEGNTTYARSHYSTLTNSCTYMDVITEDRGLGLELYKRLARSAITSGGNTGFRKYLKRDALVQALYVSDGANSGRHFFELYRLAMSRKIDLIYPECFEWVILSTPMFQQLPEIQEELSRANIDANKPSYVSWESYYTEMLNKAFKCAGLPKSCYQKSSDSVIENCLFGSCDECPNGDRKCRVYYTGNKLLDIARLLGVGYLIENK